MISFRQFKSAGRRPTFPLFSPGFLPEKAAVFWNLAVVGFPALGDRTAWHRSWNSGSVSFRPLI